MSLAYLIRHAEPLFGPDGRPATDAALCERGRRDATNLVTRFADVKIEAIYSSPFRRARETVTPLARSRNLQIFDVLDLRERALGHGPFDDSDFELAVRATWTDFSFAHPGGESNAAAQSRGIAALRDLQARHGNGAIILSSHATLVALILNSFDSSIGFEFWRGISMPDVHRLEVDQTAAPRISRVYR